jgi:hypothetical protein
LFRIINCCVVIALTGDKVINNKERRKGKRAYYGKNKGTGKACYIYLTSCALCFRHLFVIL